MALRHNDGCRPERQTLTIRIACRRLTRLCNGLSTKLENLKAALALHFAWHNLVKIHRTLVLCGSVNRTFPRRDPWTVEDDGDVPKTRR